MEWLVYAIYGLLLVVFGVLLWLIVKDAKPTSHHSGRGGGHGVNINHWFTKKNKDQNKSLL